MEKRKPTRRHSAKTLALTDKLRSIIREHGKISTPELCLEMFGEDGFEAKRYITSLVGILRKIDHEKGEVLVNINRELQYLDENNLIEAEESKRSGVISRIEAYKMFLGRAKRKVPVQAKYLELAYKKLQEHSQQRLNTVDDMITIIK